MRMGVAEALRECSAALLGDDSTPDTSSPAALQALDILRELDTASAGAEDRCEEACKTLLDPQAEQLLKVIGWDLLHTFLPFVSVASASCRAAARQLLLRVAALCNPREIFSMVLEGLSLFKGRAERRLLIQMHAVILPLLRVKDTSSYIRSFDSTIERYLEACATCAQSSADQDDMQEEQLGGSSKVQVASCLREHRHTQEIVSICRLASEALLPLCTWTNAIEAADGKTVSDGYAVCTCRSSRAVLNALLHLLSWLLLAQHSSPLSSQLKHKRSGHTGHAADLVRTGNTTQTTCDTLDDSLQPLVTADTPHLANAAHVETVGETMDETMETMEDICRATMQHICGAIKALPNGLLFLLYPQSHYAWVHPLPPLTLTLAPPLPSAPAPPSPHTFSAADEEDAESDGDSDDEDSEGEYHSGHSHDTAAAHTDIGPWSMSGRACGGSAWGRAAAACHILVPQRAPTKARCDKEMDTASCGGGSGLLLLTARWRGAMLLRQAAVLLASPWRAHVQAGVQLAREALKLVAQHDGGIGSLSEHDLDLSPWPSRHHLDSKPHTTWRPAASSSALPHASSSSSPMLLVQGLATAMTQVPDQSVRQQAHGLLLAFVRLLAPDPRFAVFSHLLRTCPYTPVTALLMHELKQQFQAAWPQHPPDSPDHHSHASPPRPLLALSSSGPFLTFGVSLLLDSLGTPSRGLLMQRLDVYMAALNAVRFLLIKDSLLSNVTGIWLADTRRTLSTQVIHPLLSISQQVLKDMQDESSDMTDQMHVLMLREVLERIEELLDTNTANTPPASQPFSCVSSASE